MTRRSFKRELALFEAGVRRLLALVYGPSWYRENVPHVDTVTIYPQDAAMVVRVNEWIIRALQSIAEILKTLQPEDLRVFVDKLKWINREIQEKLMVEEPVRYLKLTGYNALMYYGILELVHARYALVRRAYIEDSVDIKNAERESREAFRVIKSILMSGVPSSASFRSPVVPRMNMTRGR